jgi:lipopolysaccharide biosynthesis glycosyltransferase
VVIDGDISELWGEDLGDRPLGAISEDGNFFDFKSRERHRGKLGIPMGNSCYGSGTLLINCEKFVKSKIFARVIDCIKTVQVQLSCPEQDAMNICLGRDERMSLSPRYGFCPCAPLAKMCLKKIGRPVVVHYACFKPWLMSRATVNAFHFLGLFKWQTSNFLKFWDYAAEIGFSPNSPGAVRRTLGFLFKRLFQPVERLVSKGIRDNFLAFWKKSFEQKVPWRKQ